MTGAGQPGGDRDGQAGGRCWWRGHKWGRWEVVNVHMNYIDEGVKSTVTKQARRCRRCGLHQRKGMSG